MATGQVNRVASSHGACMNKTPELPRIPNAEKALIFVIFSMLFVIRLFVTARLSQLGVFEQYNVFFDADPNQYVSAISDGWSFGRSVHPAFALLLNVPTRALDFVAAYLGIISPGTIRSVAPMVAAPLFSCLGGLWWWAASWRAGFSIPARIAGVLFFQLSFSETVFSVLPESYALSGALFSALLFLSVKAAQDPNTLNSKWVRIQWLALACLMSGVTVTNGFLCIAVWVSIRFEKKWPRRAITEGVIAAGILGGAIVTMVAADRFVYQLPKDTHQTSVEDISKWTQSGISSVLDRAAGIPASYVASVFSPGVEKIPNVLAQPNHHHQYGFGLESNSKSQSLMVLGWLAIGALAARLLQQRSCPIILRAIGAVLISNGILHSFFGTETFLYSQHWLPFLTFAMILPVSKSVSWRSNAILLILVFTTLALSLHAWIGMFEILNSAFQATSYPR
ncbi:MAG: hypothetical protein ABTQ25_07145 [Nitrosomonas ureae]